MRVHAFLEKQGIINFNTLDGKGPVEKPMNQFLLQESGHDRLHINMANKHSLTRNEFEFAESFYLKDTDRDQRLVNVQVRDDLVKKTNIATLKYRPKCTFTGAVCGLRWYND